MWKHGLRSKSDFCLQTFQKERVQIETHDLNSQDSWACETRGSPVTLGLYHLSLPFQKAGDQPNVID